MRSYVCSMESVVGRMDESWRSTPLCRHPNGVARIRVLSASVAGVKAQCGRISWVNSKCRFV